MTNAIHSSGNPDAGNPRVRFDEGEIASAKPRRGSPPGRFGSYVRYAIVIVLSLCLVQTSEAGISSILGKVAKVAARTTKKAGSAARAVDPSSLRGGACAVSKYARHNVREARERTDDENESSGGLPIGVLVVIGIVVGVCFLKMVF